MKKLTLMAVLLSLALVACGEKKVEEVKEAAAQAVEQTKEVVAEAAEGTKEAVAGAAEGAKEAVSNAVEQTKEAVAGAAEGVKEAVVGTAEVINFKTADGEAFSVESSDLFETAVLKNANGEAFELKRDASASGVRLVGENGTEIHFNSKEGNLKLNDKEYILNITE
ncbi:MAG: hypothetical protein IJG31_00350 [Fusobacterium sp.]|nr:hypothetical protein [Fusobacterium sp.]